MDARCHIELFGALRVTQGSVVHTRFRSHKAAALLSYLALSLPNARSREHLVELFWPDKEIGVGRDNLSTTLSQLRRQLEPTGVPAKSALISDHQQVRLNPATVSTDLAEFDRLIALGKHTGEPASRLPLLLRVVELYRGELLPANYEDWAIAEQNRCRTAYREALALLTETQEERGDITGALAAAQRMIEADPYEETAYCAQMRLHLRLDRPTAALEVYGNLERLYQKEMGAQPSPEIRALAEYIRDDPRTRPPISVSKLRSAAPPARTPAATAPAEAIFSPTTDLTAPPLPLQLTRLFGRQEEQEALCKHLLTPENRLVTLLGTGGVGKTRLSVAVAEQVLPAFAGRVWFVSLAEAPNASFIPYALLNALRLPHSNTTSDPFERVVEALGAEPCLLVLDNFEHLLWEAPEPGKSDQPFAGSGPALVRLLLSRITGLAILVTSRQTLRLAGEQEFALSPLPVPDANIPPAEILLDNASVALFTERARAVKPDFNLSDGNSAHVAKICRMLEGMPLAIEMAAAWIRTLSPQSLMERLDKQLNLLVSRQRDMPARHRSLRATIEWSYNLLSPELRDFFAFLGVFRGGWTLEAAEAICGPEALPALSKLQEHSLALMEERDGETRYRLLEPLREFAVEQLQAMKRWEAAQRSHVAYFLAFAEDAETKLLEADQKQWLNKLEADHDNLRSAMEGEDKETSLRIAGALWRFWHRSGYWNEGRMRLSVVLGETGEDVEAAVRAKALHAAGTLARSQGDYTSARSLYEESLTMRRELGDRRGIAHSLHDLGNVDKDQGNYAAARALYEQSLKMRRELGDQWGMTTSLLSLGNVAYHLSNYASARRLYEESLTLWQELGDRLGIAHSLLSLGNVAYAQEDYDTARKLYEESLEIRRETGTKLGISFSLMSLGNLASAQGEYASARRLYEESLTLRRELGDRLGITECLEAFASLAVKTGSEERAPCLWGAATALREVISSPLTPDEHQKQEREMASTRKTLGEATFTAGLQEGRAMTLEQAIAYALENSDLLPPA